MLYYTILKTKRTHTALCMWMHKNNSQGKVRRSLEAAVIPVPGGRPVPSSGSRGCPAASLSRGTQAAPAQTQSQGITRAPVLLHSLPWPVSIPHVPCMLARSLLQCWAQGPRAPLGGWPCPPAGPAAALRPGFCSPAGPSAAVPAPQVCTQPGPGPPTRR